MMVYPEFYTQIRIRDKDGYCRILESYSDSSNVLEHLDQLKKVISLYMADGGKVETWELEKSST